MVFQTAPRHPASKARITCSPQFVGGAEASQNGFWHLIPAKVVSSVGLGLFMLGLQPRSYPDRCALSIGDGIDDLAPSVRAITACEVHWIRGLASRTINEDTPALKLNPWTLVAVRKERSLGSLSDREDNEIGVKQEL